MGTRRGHKSEGEDKDEEVMSEGEGSRKYELTSEQEEVP